MNTASLELCKELYELSGWRDCPFVYEDNETIALYGTPGHDGTILPAYDLGYLLRKLPRHSLIERTLTQPQNIEEWRCSYQNLKTVGTLVFWADNPEDAACKLAIELFKQKVIKP